MSIEEYFSKDLTINDLLNKIKELQEENKQLKLIDRFYLDLRKSFENLLEENKKLKDYANSLNEIKQIILKKYRE